MRDAPSAPDRPPSRLPSWIKYVVAAGAVSAASVGARMALPYERVEQPSGSMWPTLARGEHFFAKGATGQPERGSIAMFRYPERPEQSFAKRVVGLSGDIIETKGTDVIINGWTIPTCVVGKASFKDGAASGGSVHEGQLVIEFLADATYLVFHDQQGPAALASDAWGPFMVARGEYFVLGDNRENSHDSRAWFGGAGGGVPYDNTQGTVSRTLERLPSYLDASLGPSLAACLAKRPKQTTPPPPSARK